MHKSWITKGEEKGTWFKAGGVEVFANRHLLVWSGSVESFDAGGIEDYLPEKYDLFNVCEFPKVLKTIENRFKGNEVFKMREEEKELLVKGLKGIGKAGRYVDFVAFYGNGVFMVSDKEMEEEVICCIGLEEREGKKEKVLFPFVQGFGTRYLQDMGKDLVIEPMGEIGKVEYCKGQGKRKKNWKGYLQGMKLDKESVDYIKERGKFI